MITRNTATTRFFLAYNTDDGAPATGLASNSFTVQLAKDAGSLLPLTGRTITEIGGGIYRINLTADDTNCSNGVLRIIHVTAIVEPILLDPFEPATVGSAVLAAFYGDENGYDLIPGEIHAMFAAWPKAPHPALPGTLETIPSADTLDAVGLNVSALVGTLTPATGGGYETLAIQPTLSAVAGNVTSVLGKLPATGTVPNTTTAMTLTGDYDKAKTAASAAEVWNNTTRTLTSATAPTATENAAAVWAATTRTLTTNFPTVPTVAQITTGVWDAASRSLTTEFPTVPSSTDNANAVITALGSNDGYTNLLRDVTKMVGQFPDSGTLATIGAAMTLTPAYDAAKTAAQAASLTALASTVTTIKAKTDLIDGTPATVEDLPSPTDLAPVQNQIEALSTLVNNGVVAKLPASGTVPNTATPMTLVAAYDRAKNAASSTEVAAAADASALAVTTHGGAGPWTSASATSGVTVGQLQTELAALEAHGDETWSTATGFATPENILASQQAIIAHGDVNWVGGGGEGGGATPAQIAGAVWNYAEGDGRTISGQNDLATADGLSGVQEAIIVHGDRYWMAGGNEPDPPAADAYASVNDLYLRWGYINVRAWADIDNDRDAGKIMARILWALQSATAAMNKVIERSNYKCPLERVDASYPLVPQTERNICAGMAGEILFKGRQIAATNDSPTIERAVEDFNNWSNDILNGGFIAGVKGKND